MSKNNQYHKNLKQQMQNRLFEMLQKGLGQSKQEDKRKENTWDKIYSRNTYQTYRKHCNYFADYIREKHPKCTTLNGAKKYVNEWLEWRNNYVDKKGRKLSNWTIQLEAKALGKLYNIRPDDPDYFVCPKRCREDIKRSRGTKVRDTHFSEKANEELINFCILYRFL